MGSTPLSPKHVEKLYGTPPIYKHVQSRRIIGSYLTFSEHFQRCVIPVVSYIVDLIEQKKVNQGLMNRQIFDLQTQLQNEVAKANMPAPLQLGPSLSAQSAMVEEACKKP